MARFNIAVRQSSRRETEALLSRLLPDLERFLGTESPLTLKTCLRLAELVDNQEERLHLPLDLLPRLELVLDHGQPDTVRVWNVLSPERRA